MIKTFLFDLDGTLIQTTEIIIDTFKMTFKKYFPNLVLTDSEYSNLLGQTLWKTFEFYADESSDIDEIVSYYRALSNQMIEAGLKAYPGAAETLKYLKAKGCKVGVVTSKMRKIATYHLELTGLLPYIDHVVGYEDVSEHKPAPEPITKALVALGARAKTAVYIGDHENDIIAAKKAGVLACAVTYSQRLAEMLSYQPDYVIDELEHIKDFI
jgi:HAD superfamily hydrolase (TIGR01509 family)